jgi:pimeloyl-ACP methyl ester carboxylesterase
MRLRLLLAGLAALAVMAAAATPGWAADKIAVILLHGGGSNGSQFDNIMPVMERAGYHVVAPDMCWGESRRYDEGAQACLADVDKQVDRLKAAGYQRIVIGGHSQGGIFAIYYAANRSGLAGVIAYAPSGPPTGMDSNSLSVAYAHKLIGAGQGDIRTDFGGGIDPIMATPNDYLSWRGMESPLHDVELLPKLTAPILWVAGTDDPGQKTAAQRFKYAPQYPLNQLVSVEADHFGTPDAAVKETIAWLDRLAAAGAANR